MQSIVGAAEQMHTRHMSAHLAEATYVCLSREAMPDTHITSSAPKGKAYV